MLSTECATPWSGAGVGVGMLMVLWFHGFMVYGFKVCCFYGVIVVWFDGFRVSWSIVLWFYGHMFAKIVNFHFVFSGRC